MVKLQLLSGVGRTEPVHEANIHGPVAELGHVHEGRVARVEAFVVHERFTDNRDRLLDFLGRRVDLEVHEVLGADEIAAGDVNDGTVGEVAVRDG